MKTFATLFAATFILSGCGASDKSEAREDRLRAALVQNDAGIGSRAVWLVKRSSVASDDRTAIFFGYVDNRGACEEFVAAYEQANPDIKYACDTLD